MSWAEADTRFDPLLPIDGGAGRFERLGAMEVSWMRTILPSRMVKTTHAWPRSSSAESPAGMPTFAARTDITT